MIRGRIGLLTLVAGGLATLTMLAAPGQRAVLILQFLLVAAVMLMLNEFGILG